MPGSSVCAETPWRRAIPSHTARCTAVDCPCAGDDAVHAAHSAAQPAAQAPADVPADGASMVECPECGEPSTPARIATWGHCRVCRTADSRQKSPLRW